MMKGRLLKLSRTKGSNTRNSVERHGEEADERLMNTFSSSTDESNPYEQYGLSSPPRGPRGDTTVSFSPEEALKRIKDDKLMKYYNKKQRQ
jgi:hypothetical protein